MNPDRFHLTRRGFLVTGVAALAATTTGFASAPGCTLTPEQEPGPFYIDDEILRPDITMGKPGVPLNLRIALVDANRCAPLENAAVDIWHCDATGVYSGFTSNTGMPGPPPPGGPGGGPNEMPPPPPNSGPSDETRFLRGVQLTDKQGIATFRTVYPGWYVGRAIHIHLKVHLGGTANGVSYSGGHVSHTGQLFLPEEITQDIAATQPYAQRQNVHRTLQSEDSIFRHQHGGASMLNLTRLSARSNSGGFQGTVMLAIDPESTPAPVGGFRRRPRA